MVIGSGRRFLPRGILDVTINADGDGVPTHARRNAIVSSDRGFSAAICLGPAVFQDRGDVEAIC